MALTITTELATVLGGQGNRSLKLIDIDFDSSYPTSGESLTPASINFLSIDFLYAETTSGFVFEYNYSGELLLAYYADYDAVADGALIQVANATDLSSVTNVRAMVIGQSL